MARILKFPALRREANPLSTEEAEWRAVQFLETPRADRTRAQWDDLIAQAEVLFSVCERLRTQADLEPAKVAAEAPGLYSSVLASSEKIGLFDEGYYVLGELAYCAQIALRHLGRLEEAEHWLDRAEAGYRHTVNPAPLLANVSYGRLALRYEKRRYNDVLELLPSLQSSFRKLGMESELRKTRFMEGMTLKESGRGDEALKSFEGLLEDLRRTNERSLLGMTLVEVGEQRALRGDFAQATKYYDEALSALSVSGSALTVAHLKGVIGETYRNQGDLTSAVASFRAALADYAEIGAQTRVAYYRVIMSETLIAAGRTREAEWELLTALPTIEEQQMVPEGFAAVALLKESVRRRKTDPNALRELREHLQAANQK